MRENAGYEDLAVGVFNLAVGTLESIYKLDLSNLFSQRICGRKRFKQRKGY